MRRHFSILFALLACTGTALAQSGAELPPSEMGLVQALILGIVEGLTEYLPVSSTGHLILTQRMMGISQSEVADAYVLSIQVGAILAVLGLFRPHLVRITRGLAGKDPEGRKLASSLVLAFLPAMLLGYFLMDFMKSFLFGLWPIVAAWWFGGMAILIVSYFVNPNRNPGKTGLFELTWRQALIIGLIQCTAIWPGTSRSLVTIVGGILVGMEISAAVVFSFLLGAMTLSAVTVYEFMFYGTSMLDQYGLLNISAGILTALVSAAVAVKWMVGYLQRHSLALFGWYRVVLAVTVAVLLMMGVMDSR